MTPAKPDGRDASGAGDASDSVVRAERFLKLVETITEAHLHLLPTMTERYFRRMVLRMAEHQLLYEEFRDKQP
jgi:hypothetical protein